MKQKYPGRILSYGICKKCHNFMIYERDVIVDEIGLSEKALAEKVLSSYEANPNIKLIFMNRCSLCYE